MDLIGPRNYPYFSIAIRQILVFRYFHLYLVCSLLALLHLTAEWLYLGKYPQRLWLSLVLSLCLVGLLQNYWIQPSLSAWHHARYSGGPQSEGAARAFRAWSAASEVLNLLAACGLTFYLWRVAHPAETARVLNAAKFRS